MGSANIGEMVTAVLAGLFVLGIMTILLVLKLVGPRRTTAMIDRWLTENHLKLLHRQDCNSPFKAFYGPGGTSNTQILTRVTVQYPDGRVVEGWLRLGGPILGPFAHQVEWFPETSKPAPIDDLA